MPHNPKGIPNRVKGEGWLIDLTPKNRRQNKVKLYRGFLLVSDTRRSDYIIDDHLDLGRFGTLDEAKKAIDRLINKRKGELAGNRQ